MLALKTTGPALKPILALTLAKFAGLGLYLGRRLSEPVKAFLRFRLFFALAASLAFPYGEGGSRRLTDEVLLRFAENYVMAFIFSSLS